jgi:hypothetical protein
LGSTDDATPAVNLATGEVVDDDDDEGAHRVDGAHAR